MLCLTDCVVDISVVVPGTWCLVVIRRLRVVRELDASREAFGTVGRRCKVIVDESAL
jgi:hypothetical protein